MPLVSRTFDQLIDFTRTSAGTFVGSNGLIQNTAASRNLLTFTQEFDNAAWTKSGSTVTANSTAAPDGTTTADTLTANGGATAGFSVTMPSAGGAHTASIYAKAGTKSVIQFSANAASWGSDARANFDLSSGTLGTVDAGLTATITSVGNGWYRCAVAATKTASAGQLIWVTVDSGTSAREAAATAGNIFLWGAQLEAGSTATDYTRNFGGLFPPRFDFDPVTLAPRGLLIEEQRTNLFTYSQDFANVAWDADGLTKTSGLSGGLDGTASVGEFSKTGAGAHYPRNTATNLATNTTYTISAWLWHTGTAPTNTRFAYFAGSWITSPALAVTTTPTRFTWTVTTGATVPTVGTGLNLDFGAGGGAIRIWGAQAEAGAFATSYIPTVASQVTRTADIATINAPNFAPWYRADEGTIVFEYVRAAGTDLSAGRVFASGVGGSNSYGIWVNQATGSQDQVTIRDISGDAVNGQLFNVNSAGVNKGAVAYKVNDFAWASNGGAPATDNTGVVPSLSDQLRLGRAINTDSAFLNGHIRSIRYYPVRLSNAQLQALTA